MTTRLTLGAGCALVLAGGCVLSTAGRLAGEPVADAGGSETTPPPVPDSGGTDSGSGFEGGDDGAADAGDAGSAEDAGVDGGGVDSGEDSSAPHTITFVQGVTSPSLSAGSVSASMTTTGGDLLVVVAYWEGGGGATVSDTLGSKWQSTPPPPAPPCTTGSGQTSAQIDYAESVRAGADSVTLTIGGTHFLGFVVLEYAGVASPGSLDAHAGQSAPNGGSSAMTTGSVKTTTPLDVIVAGFADTNGSGTMTPGGGYASRGIDTFYFSLAEDDLPGVGAGSYAPGAGLPGGTSDDCWTAVAAAFKAR